MLPIRIGRGLPGGLAILEKTPGKRRGPNLLIDGDMEDVGVGAWTAVNSVLTKPAASPYEGLQTLRVTKTTAGSGGARQSSITTVGNSYRITIVMRSDGAAFPRVYDGAWALHNGTLSTSWQTVDVTYVAQSTFLMLYASVGGVGTYCEFDDAWLSEE